MHKGFVLLNCDLVLRTLL